ncbi:hypothetical protein OHB35_28155 [Streptomyces phaeochromogenes]|uniref:Uncharacterized protein n=1 Tax=Streptomyces phaeochromogenes TaxID=1923 RepID=A0ABZ1HDY5_STRPH|nr:hypothetical protein [Streptomyces phaeochromogenes]WSD16812.1 hypothetical protein OHB35_28155 [Streptomyces phaeochromogenes]
MPLEFFLGEDADGFRSRRPDLLPEPDEEFAHQAGDTFRLAVRAAASWISMPRSLKAPQANGQ